MSSGDAAGLVRGWIAALGRGRSAGNPELNSPADSCPVLAWAASGAMALTGHADQLPVVTPAPALGLLEAVSELLGWATGRTGTAVRPDPAELLTVRAGLTGLTRHGRISAGGGTRLLRTADGWCALTLSRPDDVASVPAILGQEATGDPWDAIAGAAPGWRAADLARRAQLLGVPAAALPGGAFPDGGLHDAVAGPVPWRIGRIAAGRPDARLAGALVVDLSPMWAGPLCARLLGQAGADVIKVESAGRPDGVRAGDARFFGWLHGGHRSVQVDFTSASGRAALAALLGSADVVIEASRPRALAQLGLAPGMVPHRDGQVWLSITGYGRETPERVAFGDDAAVAGGLVGWDHGTPVFCADAVADPLAGTCGALAVACSVAAGGGHLIDLSMLDTAAAFAAAPAGCPGPHQARGGGRAAPPDKSNRERPEHGEAAQAAQAAQAGQAGLAVAECHRLGREQPVRPPRAPAVAGTAAEPGADTADVLAWLATC